MPSQIQPVTLNGIGVDLSARVKQSATVIGSPAAAAETVIATTPAFGNDVAFQLGVFITCELAYTLGTSASACTVKIRQGTGTSGTVIYSTGAMTGGHNTATQLVSDSAQGFDTAPAAGQQYTVTLQVTGGAAASTVSAVSIVAIGI